MKTLSSEIVHFFYKQNFVIVSTVDRNGKPHCSCKGVVDIEPEGKIYLLDLYMSETYSNLKRNKNISIAAVDEHSFIGYCLKGEARISRIKSHIMQAWSDKIVSRISHRIIKKIRGERGHPRHPEALFPRPKYMIVMKVTEIVDLTPAHLK